VTHDRRGAGSGEEEAFVMRVGISLIEKKGSARDQKTGLGWGWLADRKKEKTKGGAG